MKNIFKIKIVWILLSAIAIIIILLLSLVFLKQTTQQNNNNIIVSKQKNINSFSYQGKEGVDALTLLKQQAEISLDSSGMVAVINERKSNSKEHEYWAFYINGSLASVGPADYNTKNKDVIEWRIEKY